MLMNYGINSSNAVNNVDKMLNPLYAASAFAEYAIHQTGMTTTIINILQVTLQLYPLLHLASLTVVYYRTTTIQIYKSTLPILIYQQIVILHI